MVSLTEEVVPVSQLWVASMNINGFIKYHWDERKLLCAEVLRNMPAQLIGFQEFGKHCQKLFEFNRPKLNFIVSEPMGDIHNAIAFDRERFEFKFTNTIPLSPSGRMEPAWEGGIRSFMFAELHDLVYKTDILFINFHLDNKSAPARTESLKLILKFVNEYKSMPIIFVGDANVSAGSPHARWHYPELRAPYDMMLQAGFRDCCLDGNPTDANRKNTFHDFRGGKYEGDDFGTWDVDWNFVSPHWNTIDSVRIMDSAGGMYPSDHYFLQSLIRLKNE